MQDEKRGIVEGDPGHSVRKQRSDTLAVSPEHLPIRKEVVAFSDMQRSPFLTSRVGGSTMPTS